MRDGLLIGALALVVAVTIAAYWRIDGLTTELEAAQAQVDALQAARETDRLALTRERDLRQQALADRTAALTRFRADTAITTEEWRDQPLPASLVDELR